MKRILLFVLALPALLSAQDHLSPSRSDVDNALVPFYHGVASGDPLSDRVIIWTRVTTDDPSVSVNWEIALDTTFATPVNSGTVTTDSSSDYTVKVDVTGLQPNTWYYYRFKAINNYSIIGRTRTAPVSNLASNLRFAVVACSNYQDGFFNVYRDIKTKNDVDAVIHLGDYYYEYGISDFTPGIDSSRIHEPDYEILTMADYRLRHSQYKLDPDLRAVHQQYPFITVWDDHETANDAWSGGAQNHTDSVEGNWADRKEYGRKAYFEWMPIRNVYNSVDTIHRTLPFGDLVDFIMIDTRLEGRAKQLATSDPAIKDSARSLLGPEQLGWFKQQLSNSTAKWKLIGNQVMMAPLQASGTIFNADQWDGYPAERKRVLSHIAGNNINNVVVLTGDIHTSWANDVPLDVANYTPATGAGSVAVEYVCTSVTSGSFITFSGLEAFIQPLNPYMKYINLVKRGYLLLDVTQQKVQGDWIYVDRIDTTAFTASTGASWCDLDLANHLTNCGSTPLQTRSNRQMLAPEVNTRINTGIKPENNLVTISCYPNPFDREIAIQYYLHTPAKVELMITDINGKAVYHKAAGQTQAGLYSSTVDISGFASGTYLASLISDGKVYSKKIVKVN